MPVYAYICKDCGEKFDLLIGVTSERIEFKCKKCNSKNIEKRLGAFSVGGTDNQSASSGPSCPTGTCPTCY
ncbi:MAG: zinc ribbon domain-containing protein [Candidatus Omnitrophica bacterium]|nr:zinc ribbon domain-containing protein [Candidatus Omnitrophota bacterium]